MEQNSHVTLAQPSLFDPMEPVIPPIQVVLPNHLKDGQTRLRDRLIGSGSDTLEDFELLELILGSSCKRLETRDLVGRLLDQFGDFSAVISAPAQRLREVQGVTRAIIQELKTVEAAAHRLAQKRVLQRHVMNSWDALLDYCQTVMAHRDVEQFRILFLDNKNVLIADEAQAKGTVDHVPVYPREVIKRALELNACALILVHNHPSGDPTPSACDISMTEHIQRAAEIMNITLHDHLVIGRSRSFSFRSDGLL